MISIVFDTPPGPESQFVEVERDGESIRFGEWKQFGDFWHLELVEVVHLEEQLAEAQETIRIDTERRDHVSASRTNSSTD